ncbi:MAG: alpha-mannosidase [Gorillibacterium sp.]|nr:alpha-mannosidase [Gorillibacterium sp.]
MKRIDRFINLLATKQWSEKQEIKEWNVRESRYIIPGVYEYATELGVDQPVDRLAGGRGTTYFLHKVLSIPRDWPYQETALLYIGVGEGLLCINGSPYHGLDRNHWFISLPEAEEGTLELDIELFDPLPEPEDALNHQAAIRPSMQGASFSLVRINPAVYSLLHTVKIIHEAAGLLPVQDMRRIRLEQILEQAMDALYPNPEVLADADKVSEVEQRLRAAAVIERPAEQRNGIMHMVGQSHIDIAWLWPLRETVRKVSRTFSTVCALMDKYPDFYYSQSQPQLYAYAKQHYPQLYERMKARIAEGRWELVGGMWVEPDLNIPSGESLVRQLLYGQGFYMQEFGKQSRIEWLPDTFGYCASLPQLLKQAGIDSFMTTKLGWNDTNQFPHTLFHWVGIDGTSIVAYQNHGLNEHTRPVDIHKHWDAYSNKAQHDQLMLLYGHGDGGGGVTHEMLENIARANLMPELPESKTSTAAAFFGEIERLQPELPKWHGDLYLELHRGTFTTHAFNKRSNRKAELLYRRAEIWSRLAESAKAGVEEESTLQEGWKLLLLNQFHDIIPGTAITEVYETSREQYQQVFRLGNDALHAALSALAASIHTVGEGQPYLIFNSLGWERAGVIVIEGDSRFAHLQAFAEAGPLVSDAWHAAAGSDKVTLAIQVPAVPAFGCRTIWLREAPEGGLHEESRAEEKTNGHSFPDIWETACHLLQFNEQGEIIRWFDKKAGRELILEGQKANELQFYHDTPTEWDAWDLDSRYEQQPAGKPELLERKVLIHGKVLDILGFRWQLNCSVIEQKIIFYKHTGRVDFQTTVDWQEEHKLLKVAFPVEILATKATYEIPFGALERPTHRNTSWEQAQFEVCGHRFADLSENGYGVSLLNDCKYGYDIHDGVMRLSLLRSPGWPDQLADRGEHVFTYSLYPHAGDWRQAKVVREAADLNEALQAVKTDAHSGLHPSQHAWLNFQSEHVQLETIKRAEDGSGTILRMYESAGGRDTVTLDLLKDNLRFSQVNLLEEESSQLAATKGKLTLTFKPFEVKTIKIIHEPNAKEE